MIRYKNLYTTELSGPITAGATLIPVLSVVGIPDTTGDNYFDMLLDDNTNQEVVRVVSVTGLNLTVVRNLGGTNSAFPQGTFAVGSISAQLLEIIQNRILLTAGAVNAYTITKATNETAYYDGFEIKVRLHLANTGAATIDVNGIGAVPIRFAERPLRVGDFPINSVITAVYDGTSFIIPRGKVVNNQEASATTPVATTSSTDVLLTGMTLTPGAGNYLAMFSADFENNSNTDNQTVFTIYVNGVAVAKSVRSQFTTDNNHPTVVSIICRLPAVLDAQAVEIRWRVTGNTSTCRARTLNLIEVN